GAWAGPPVSRKSRAAKASDGPAHRQRDPLCWHSDGRGSPSRKRPPPPEWHRYWLPDSPAEETAAGLRRGAARVSVGRVSSVCVPWLLTMFHGYSSLFRNVLYVTIITRITLVVKGQW